MLLPTARLFKVVKDRNCFVLAITSILLLSLVYQVDLPVAVQVGDYLDRAYAINFRPPVGKGEDGYRLTRKLSSVLFPGLGSNIPRQIAVEAMASAPTRFKIEVNGADVGWFDATDQWRRIVAHLPPAALAASDLTIAFRTTSETGFGVRLVEVRSIQADSGAILLPLHPGVIVTPDWQRVISLSLVIVLSYLLFVVIGLGRLWSLAIAIGELVGLALLLAYLRIYLTIFDVGLVQVIAACGVLVMIAQLVLPPMFRRGGVALQRIEWLALFLLLYLLLGIKMGGVLYPQFESSDLLYHQHRLEEVIAGDLFSLHPVSEFGNMPVPVAPGLYLFLTPLAALIQDRELILKLSAVIFDAGSAVLVFFIARRMLDDARPALIAALVYAFTPVTFLLTSAGNIPNLFGQFLLLLLMALVLAGPAKLNGIVKCALLAFLVAISSVTHMGNVIVMAALVGSFIAIWAIFPPLRSERKAIAWLLLAAAIGGIVSFALYYSNFAGQLIMEFRELAVARFGGGLRVAGSLNFEKVPLAITTAVVLAGLGGNLLGWKSFSAVLRRAQVAWLSSAAVFVGFAQFAGMYVRYNIFVLPALALGAGVGSIWLVRRSRWGYPLVAVFLAYVIWIGISFWVVRVLYTYH